MSRHNLAHYRPSARPAPLPKFWRPKLTAKQKLECGLIHWSLITRMTNGTADQDDLWNWMETGFTYYKLMSLLEAEGIPFTGEAAQAIVDQLATYEAVAARYRRTTRAGFNAAELCTARAAAQVFDSLIELDRNGASDAAALWSIEQMALIRMAAEQQLREAATC